MKSVRMALLLMAVWEMCVSLFRIPEFLLPSPTIIALRIAHEITQPYMHLHIVATFAVAVHGLFQGMLIGVVCGWMFFHFVPLRENLSWLLLSSQAIPVIALAPLFLIWIPETYWARVWVATIITFFPIYSAVYTALTRIPVEQREVAVLNGASRWQTLYYLETAQSAPLVFSGLRTSIALATTGAVVGEFLGGRDGLGALINIARGLFDTTLVFVSITFLIVITLFLRILLNSIFSRIVAFADGDSNTSTHLS